MNIDIIEEILSGIIESILLLILFQSLYDNKKFIQNNKVKAVYFCTLYAIVSYLSTYYIIKIYHTLIISIFSIILLSCITKIKFFISTIIFFSFLSIIFITESFTQIVELFIFNVNLNQLFLSQKYILIFLLASKLLQIFIVLIIFKLNKFSIRFKNGSIYNLVLQIGFLGFFIFVINFSTFNIRMTKWYNMLMFILYLIFLAIVIKSLKDYEKFINIKANYEIKEHQIKNMEEIINIIRKEKHDFANHINVIWGLCSLNKPNTVEKIKNYVGGISNDLHSSFKYISTGNDYLDGLLSIKNNFADKNHIDFDIMIDEPFNKLNIKETELISIVSNLIDNAFEAFQSEDIFENKKITFDTFIEDNKFYIEISDNAAKIPKNIQDKIFEKGFSTKTKGSSDHGFGLYITKQLTEQNNGCISFESNSQTTKFLVSFNLEAINK